jgi:hypothetical protein
MRSNYRIVLAGLAALALSGAASASASAAAPEWFYTGHALSTKPAEAGLGAKEETISASAATPLKLTTHIAGGGTVVIECKGFSEATAKITSPGLDSAKSLSLKECKVLSPVNCSVAKTLTTSEVNTELFYVNGSEVWDQYKPKTGTNFVTINISECAIEGSWGLTGTFCAKETSPTTETVVKDQVIGKPVGEGAKECQLTFLAAHPTFEGTMAFSLFGSQLGAVWTGK